MMGVEELPNYQQPKIDNLRQLDSEIPELSADSSAKLKSGNGFRFPEKLPTVFSRP